jgi:hypothetical protein
MSYSFAPYQDPPEDIPASEREQAAHPSAAHYSSSEGTAAEGATPFLGHVDPDDRVNQYETRLPLRYCPHCITDCRLDIEAAGAYLFPPVTGVLLLVLEHSNSYVRFHAWQV